MRKECKQCKFVAVCLSGKDGWKLAYRTLFWRIAASTLEAQANGYYRDLPNLFSEDIDRSIATWRELLRTVHCVHSNIRVKLRQERMGLSTMNNHLELIDE